jgi:hypothetical protein
MVTMTYDEMRKAEQDRLDLQHAALRLLLDGRLNEAPLVSPKFALDIATGMDLGGWSSQVISRSDHDKASPARRGLEHHHI